MEMPDKSKAQSAHAVIECGPVMAGRRSGAARITRVVSGDCLKHQRVIGNGTGQRSDMVERKRQRKHAAP